MQANKRFSEKALRQLRAEIEEAGGNEVFALGFLDEKGVVTQIKIAARGNSNSVLAPHSGGAATLPEPDGIPASADVLIHNHPSGFLSPSENDMIIASRAGRDGLGSFIVNNSASEVYVVAECVKRKPRKNLDGEKICAALEEGGAIASRLAVYEKRQPQLDLVRLVARAFNEDAIAAAEAGTGVGKSFAYLLPAMSFAEANDERLVISTATITLQQQLYEKDIPLVASALKSKLKTVLVKGRGNYLCPRRLEDALKEQSLFIDEEESENLDAIVRWAETTKTGSRSDLSFLPREGLWSRICSEADACLGLRCPARERCFVMALRREAADARILVVNHHLLFADLAARRDGAGYENTVVLPPYNRVILDEAHTIEEAATSFFSEQFTRIGIFSHIGRLYRKRRAKKSGLLVRLMALVPVFASGFADGKDDASPNNETENGEDRAAAAVNAVRDAADQLDEAALVFCGGEGVFRLVPSKDQSIRGGLFPFLVVLRKRINALGNLVAENLEKIPEPRGGTNSGGTGGTASAASSEEGLIWEIKSLLRRLDAAAAVCAAFLEYAENPGKVCWIEKRQSRQTPWAAFTVSPLDVSEDLREALYEPNKTVVCVSATLTVGGAAGQGSFDFWKSRSGLSGFSGPDGTYTPDGAYAPDGTGTGAYNGTRSGPDGTGRPDGTYAPDSTGTGAYTAKDTRRLLTGIYPSPFPYKTEVLLGVPRDAPLPGEGGFNAFVDQAAAALTESSGGSALVLFTSYSALRSAWETARPRLEKNGIRVLKQGDDDRSRLLKTFLEDKTSVLFATDSFWEGVDAPGETLRLVILCRLPFRTPNDPVFQARCERREAEGGNSFMELSLPEAVMKFKQGFGRLMRRSSDHGVVAVLDGRLLQKYYGRIFLQSLPETKTFFGDFSGLLRNVENFLF